MTLYSLHSHRTELMNVWLESMRRLCRYHGRLIVTGHNVNGTPAPHVARFAAKAIARTQAAAISHASR